MDGECPATTDFAHGSLRRGEFVDTNILIYAFDTSAAQKRHSVSSWDGLILQSALACLSR